MPQGDGQEIRPPPRDAVAAARRIDAICDELERALKRGESPRVEDFLERVAAEDRDLLLDELRALQEEYRTGSVPRPAKGPPPIPGYEILDVLGRGGMGIVYKARQARPERLVALKTVLTGTAASPEELSRFRAEAEAAAALRHPNVVQIYEVGEASGQPYFSMELVEGGSLARKLGGVPQPAPASAELIRILASAVQAAHEQGIVHRDLKPANVLLDRSGTPRITDFGLAKRLGASLGHSQSGSPLGTPSYMAPEQARGDRREVGPRSDVYALGAILYEMLTGRPPFRGETPVDTLRLVLDEEPIAPRALNPRAPRDLVTICLKCLEKAPEHRYATAALLAEDLRRYLDGESIQARPSTALERSVKWARRKPALAALVAVSCAALMSFLAFVSWSNAKLRASADRERDVARQAEENLEAATGFLRFFEDVQLGSPEQTAELRRSLLKRTLDVFQPLLGESGGSPVLRRTRARMYGLIARIQNDLDEPAESAAWGRKAVAEFESLAAEHPQSVEYLKLLSACVNNLSIALRRLGKEEKLEGLNAASRFVSLRDEIALRLPTDSTARSEQAMAHINLSDTLEREGQLEEAEHELRQAVRLNEKAAVDLGRNVPQLEGIAWAWTYLGSFLMRRGPERRNECVDALKKGAEILESPELRDKPGLEALRGFTFSNLAGVLGDLGRFEEADAAGDACRSAYKQLMDRQQNVPRFRHQYAGIVHNQALRMSQRGKAGEAERLWKEALRIEQALTAAHPTNREYRELQIATLNEVGFHIAQSVTATSDRSREAESLLLDAKRLSEELVVDGQGEDRHREALGTALKGLGVLCARTGEWNRAAAALQECLAALEKQPPGSGEYVVPPAEVAGIVHDRIAALAALKRPEEAVAEVDRLLRVAPKDWTKYPAAAAALSRCTEPACVSACLKLLERAIEANPASIEAIRADPALRGVVARPEFEALVERLRR